jgi:hypothetical protein
VICGSGSHKDYRAPTADTASRDCDIRFTPTLRVHSSGLPPTADVHCDRCIVRRLDSQPITDGYYTLHIDHDKTSDILNLKCMDGRWYPLS